MQKKGEENWKRAKDMGKCWEETRWDETRRKERRGDCSCRGEYTGESWGSPEAIKTFTLCELLL